MRNGDRNFAVVVGAHGELLCMDCCRGAYPAVAKRTARMETLIVAQLDTLLAPVLGNWLVADCIIPGQSCLKYRPDVLYELKASSGATRWLWIEIDEGGDVHEDSVARIEESMASREVEDCFVTRICPDVLFKRKHRTREGHMEVYWDPLPHFSECMREVADWVLRCSTSEAPPGAEERTRKFFFM